MTSQCSAALLPLASAARACPPEWLFFGPRSSIHLNVHLHVIEQGMIWLHKHPLGDGNGKQQCSSKSLASAELGYRNAQIYAQSRTTTP